MLTLQNNLPQDMAWDNKNTRYSFKTTFALKAPLSRVWNAILAYQMWPRWWKGLKDIQVTSTHHEKSLACKVGFALYSLTFTLTLDNLVPHKRIQILSSGD